MHFSRVIATIDAHAAGEPLRIVTSGLPGLAGATMLERRRDMVARHDALRRLLMWEPRGHRDMYGCILTPPITSKADYGVLFMHNAGYSTMCGHGMIALTTALLETGAVPYDAGASSVEVGYDTPAGFIQARATLTGDRVTTVSFRNVPSYVHKRGLRIALHGREVEVDVVFGGAFYTLVDASALRPGLQVDPASVDELIAVGMAVKRAVEAAGEVSHPDEPELHGIYGTIITGPAREAGPGVRGHNVTIFAEGEVDRSPCGTGTAARMASLYARGILQRGDPFVHESIIGTTFTGRVVEETTVAGRPAIVPEISGRGFITGLHQFVLDPEDETGQGFLVW